MKSRVRGCQETSVLEPRAGWGTSRGESDVRNNGQKVPLAQPTFKELQDSRRDPGLQKGTRSLSKGKKRKEAKAKRKHLQVEDKRGRTRPRKGQMEHHVAGGGMFKYAVKENAPTHFTGGRDDVKGEGQLGGGRKGGPSLQ